MRKVTLLSLLIGGLFLMAIPVNAQEVTYVEDYSQGTLINPSASNWFIQLQGGAGVLMSDYDSQLDFGKRITPTFNLMFGKWFTPGVGFRIGMDAQKLKGFSETGKYIDPDWAHIQRYWQAGPALDLMVNLTNWWCGYKTGRVYNSIVTIGFAGHALWAREEAGGDMKYQNFNLGARLGWLHTFALSKQMDFTFELRYDLNQTRIDKHAFDSYPQVLAGFTYKFRKRDWKAPVVAICPEYKYTDAQGDALVARLQAADEQIAALENQLRDCLNRPQPKAEECKEAPVVTIYFPINSARVSAGNNKVIKAVAQALSETDDKVIVTGWADNYTGSSKWNQTLRENRAKAVVKILTKNGVSKDRISTTTNENNLTSFGSKSASMDRAVTIELR